MFNKEHRKKYLRYTDSVDDDNNSDESENGGGNIDLIINKLEKNVNTGNINSGNADVISRKISCNNQAGMLNLLKYLFEGFIGYVIAPVDIFPDVLF